MRIAYCTNVRLPSERAHGHQIAQVCDALVHLDHAVTVFAPYRDNVVTQSYHEYYQAEPAVQMKHLGRFDAIACPWLPGVAGLWTLNALLRRHYQRRVTPEHFDLAYTRSPALLPALLKTGVPTIIELHQLPRRNRQQFVRHCNQCALVACLTSAMQQHLEEWGVRPEVLMAEGDAVDIRRFAQLPEQSVARQTFNIQTSKPVVGYVGRLKTLGMEKGVRYILEAVAALKEQQPHFALIVGGPEADQAEYEALATELELGPDDVLFTGSVPAAQVPAALATCDILAMPFPDFEHYRTHMSPLKMFEYMAANRIIITSDLPTVRDVLSEDTAVFCEPGSTESLADALRWIQAHPDEAAQRCERAGRLVREHYSWEERMKRVLSSVTI